MTKCTERKLITFPASMNEVKYFQPVSVKFWVIYFPFSWQWCPWHFCNKCYHWEVFTIHCQMHAWNLHFYCYVKNKNLNVSGSNHAISREPVRFIATMPSKMATQASWICDKKGRCSMKSARREMGLKSGRIPPKSVELRCIRTQIIFNYCQMIYLSSFLKQR